MHHPSFVGDLAIVLGVAAVTGLLFARLKQPSILGYLLAGLIVGPNLPVPLFANAERVHALSEFGVVLVMFSVGLEFRLKKFMAMLPLSGATGLVEIGVLMTAGYLLGGALGWSEVSSLFLGACICISSTMTVSKILEQQPLPRQDRQFIFGVLVIQDVAAIALIAVMTAVAGGGDASFGQVLRILGKLSAALMGIVAVGMFFVPRLVRVLDRAKSREVLVVGAMGICFSFALLAEAVGYSTALGAFLGGVLVAESGLGHRVEKSTASVRDMFVAVFFVSIGMSVDPAVAYRTLPTSLLVLAVVVVAQFWSVSLAGTASGNGIRRAVTSGLALGQIGEFAFILGAIGHESRILGPDFQSVLVTVAVLTTLSTSVLLKRKDQVVTLVEQVVPDRIRRILVLYESWWGQLRSPSSEPRQASGRIIVGLLLDLLLMAAIVLSWRAWRDDIAAYLGRTLSLREELTQTVAVLALGVALLPLLVPLIFGARTLASNLSGRIFPEKRSNARAVFTATMGVLIVSGLGVPATLLLGHALGVPYVWPAFLVAVTLSGRLLWRRLDTLDSELRSGGLLLLQAIAGQGYGDADGESRPSVLGFRNLHPVQLRQGDFAIGRTLAELELRTRTGASVVGVRAPEASLLIPTGAELLAEQLTLYLAGSRDSQLAGEALLQRGPGTPSEGPEESTEAE